MAQGRVRGSRRRTDRVSLQKPQSIKSALRVVGVNRLLVTAKRRKSSRVINTTGCCPLVAAASSRTILVGPTPCIVVRPILVIMIRPLFHPPDYGAAGGTTAGHHRTMASAGESIRCGDQRASIRRVEGAVAAVGGDDEVGFGPSTVERPRAFHRADDVVPPLYDYSRDV